MKRLPEILDKILTKENISKSFVDAGMTDSENKVFPVFDKLIGTCKRWVTDMKDLGISRIVKQRCKDAFYGLAQQWRELGQITYPAMLAAGIPKGM